jgi:hypothetical protein
MYMYILRGFSYIYADNICMVRRKSSALWRERTARIDGWSAFASHLLMSSVNSCRHVSLFSLSLPFCPFHLVLLNIFSLMHHLLFWFAFSLSSWKRRPPVYKEFWGFSCFRCWRVSISNLMIWLLAIKWKKRATIFENELELVTMHR